MIGEGAMSFWGDCGEQRPHILVLCSYFSLYLKIIGGRWASSLLPVFYTNMAMAVYRIGATEALKTQG